MGGKEGGGMSIGRIRNWGLGRDVESIRVHVGHCQLCYPAVRSVKCPTQCREHRPMSDVSAGTLIPGQGYTGYSNVQQQAPEVYSATNRTFKSHIWNGELHTTK